MFVTQIAVLSLLIRQRIDATVVTRVLQEGGEILGKATCEALCHSATSHSSSTGPVDNPRAKGYSAGGSSSGCGVLVSLGEVDLAIGADQGGSVRIPACNCVGLPNRDSPHSHPLLSY